MPHGKRGAAKWQHYKAYSWVTTTPSKTGGFIS
nr:MAG TPA: hypothetical protein [Caudoviricetes sp.]